MNTRVQLARASSSDYGSAWRMLECICDELATGRDAHCEAWLEAPDFSWGAVIEHAITHKLMPCVASRVLSPAFQGRLPSHVTRLLEDALLVNRARQRFFAREATNIAMRASERGLQVVPRKGIVYETTLYGSRAIRQLADIDLLAPLSDHVAVRRLLAQLGYVPGGFDPYERRIRHADRRQLAASLIGAYYPPPFFVRETGTLPFTHVHVFVDTTMTWAGCTYPDPLVSALRPCGSVAIAEGLSTVRVLSPEYELLDIILDMFQDGHLEMACGPARLKLSMFLELHLAWLRQCERGVGAMRDLLRQFGMQAPAAWVLGHLDRLCGTSSVARMELEEHARPDWLASWQPLRAPLLSWHGDMRRKLFEGGESLPAASAAGALEAAQR